jgi:hypothetical protein
LVVKHRGQEGLTQNFQPGKWTPTAQSNRAGGSFPGPVRQQKEEILKKQIKTIFLLLTFIALSIWVYPAVIGLWATL